MDQSEFLGDSVDVGKNIMVPSGQNLVLTADIDRNTAPLSEFQWFKDGVAINTHSASGHTHAISNASSSHSGDYYYKIRNAGLPGLTLTSKYIEFYFRPRRRCCVDLNAGHGFPLLPETVRWKLSFPLFKDRPVVRTLDWNRLTFSKPYGSCSATL